MTAPPEPTESERHNTGCYGHDPGEVDWGTFHEVCNALQIRGVFLGDAEGFAFRVSTRSKGARPMEPAPQGPKVLQRDEFLALGKTIAEAEERRAELLGLSEDEYNGLASGLADEDTVNRTVALEYGFDLESIDWDVYWGVHMALMEYDANLSRSLDEAEEFAGEVEGFAIKVSIKPAGG